MLHLVILLNSFASQIPIDTPERKNARALIGTVFNEVADKLGDVQKVCVQVVFWHLRHLNGFSAQLLCAHSSQ